jgi:hypothetical protein
VIFSTIYNKQNNEVTIFALNTNKEESSQTKRPEHIEVEIFQNGKSRDIVTLSEENHWCYQWTAKADGSDWKVVERNIPKGYTMTVEEQGTTFVLTNKLTPDSEPPTKKPDTGDTSNILLYLILMYTSGTALVLLGIAGKKRRA